MPVLELEFEAYCTCGAGICHEVTEGRAPGRRIPSYITVGPCGRCLNQAREEGYDEGYDQGCADTEENYKEV